MLNAFLHILFPAGLKKNHALTNSLTTLSLQFAKKFIQRTEENRGLHLEYIDTIYSGFSYHAHPEIKILIETLKYYGHKEIAPILAQKIIKCVPTYKQYDVIIPIPVHWTRRLQRGFNQAEEIASYISSKTKIPLMNCVYKKFTFGHQAHKKRNERLTAIKNAFYCKKNIKHVLLIDDVCTTGATLNAAAYALKKSGSVQVDALTVAISHL